MIGGADTIACSEILLRGIKRRHLEWDPDGRRVEVRIDAFLPRPWLGEQGLSVNRLTRRSVGDSFGGWPSNMWAAYSLHTGAVRDVGLRVDATPSRENPAHATIYGIAASYPESEDAYRQAMFLATRLHAMARFVAFRDGGVPGRVRERCGD